jgi:hypothetical protein
VFKPDAEFPTLFGVQVGPDVTTDLLNLSRTREAAVLAAVRVLNTEIVRHRARRRRKAAG